MKAFALLILAFLPTLSWANDRFRPERPEEMPYGTRVEDTLSVPGTKAIFVNFRAMRRDFPGLSKLSDRQIVEFVESHFNRIGSRQPRLDGIRQTPIPVDRSAAPLQGFRSPGAYRSLHFFVPSPDAESAASGETINVDLKGSGFGPISDGEILEMLKIHREAMGAKDPELRRKRLDELVDSAHSDGLSDHTSIAELTRLEALQKLADIRNFETRSDHQVSEVYFLLRYPFDILRSGGQKVPAIAIGRQTSFGRTLFDTSKRRIPDDLYRDKKGLKQRTFSNAAIDAGGMLITGEPLRENFGLHPGGHEERTETFKPVTYAKETADALGHAPYSVYAHLEQMLAPVMDRWRALPDSAKGLEPQSEAARKKLRIYRLAQRPRLRKADVEGIISFLEKERDPYFALLMIAKLEGKVSLIDYPRFEPILKDAVLKTEGLEALRTAAHWLAMFKPSDPDLIAEVFSKVQKTGGPINKLQLERDTMTRILLEYFALAASLPKEKARTLALRLLNQAGVGRLLMRKRVWAYRLAAATGIDDEVILSSFRNDLLDPPQGVMNVRPGDRIQGYKSLTRLAASSAQAQKLLAEVRSAQFANPEFARMVRKVGHRLAP